VAAQGGEVGLYRSGLARGVRLDRMAHDDEGAVRAQPVVDAERVQRFDLRRALPASGQLSQLARVEDDGPAGIVRYRRRRTAPQGGGGTRQAVEQALVTPVSRSTTEGACARGMRAGIFASKLRHEWPSGPTAFSAVPDLQYMTRSEKRLGVAMHQCMI